MEIHFKDSFRRKSLRTCPMAGKLNKLKQKISVDILLNSFVAKVLI